MSQDDNELKTLSKDSAQYEQLLSFVMQLKAKHRAQVERLQEELRTESVQKEQLRYKNAILQQYYVRAEKRNAMGRYNVSLEEAVQSANSETQLDADELQMVEAYVKEQGSRLRVSSGPAESGEDRGQDAQQRIKELQAQLSGRDQQLQKQIDLIGRLEERLKQAAECLERSQRGPSQDETVLLENRQLRTEAHELRDRLNSMQIRLDQQDLLMNGVNRAFQKKQQELEQLRTMATPTVVPGNGEVEKGKAAVERIRALEAQVRALEEENGRLRQQGEGEMQKSQERLAAEAGELQAMVQSLGAQVALRVRQEEEAETRLAETQKECAELREQLRERTAEALDLKQSALRASALNLTQPARVRFQDGADQEAPVQLKQQIIQQQGQIQALQAQIKQLQKQLSQEQPEEGAASRQLTELQGKYEQSLRDLSLVKRVIQEKARAVGELQAETESLRLQVDEAVEQKFALEGQLAALQVFVSEREKQREEEAQTLKETPCQQCEELLHQVAILEQRLIEQAEGKNRLEESCAQMEQQSRDEQLMSSRELQELRNHYEETLRDARARCDTLQQQLQECSGAREEAEARLFQAQKELASLAAEKASVEECVAAALQEQQKQAAEQAEKLRRAAADRDEKQAALASAQQQLQASRVVESEFETRLKEIQQAADDQTAQLIKDKEALMQERDLAALQHARETKAFEVRLQDASHDVAQLQLSLKKAAMAAQQEREQFAEEQKQQEALFQEQAARLREDVDYYKELSRRQGRLADVNARVAFCAAQQQIGEMCSQKEMEMRRRLQGLGERLQGAKEALERLGQTRAPQDNGEKAAAENRRLNEKLRILDKICTDQQLIIDRLKK